MKTKTDRFDCQVCGGAGEVVVESGSDYHADFGGYYPREIVVSCEHCAGTGVALCVRCRVALSASDLTNEDSEYDLYCVTCSPVGLAEDRSRAEIRALRNNDYKLKIDELSDRLLSNGWDSL